MFRIAMVAIFWGAIIMLKGLYSIKFMGIPLSPIVGAAVSLLNVVMPEPFSMGVSDWNTANLFERLMPVAVCCTLIFLTTFIYQSYAVAFLNSVLVGMIVPHLGKIIDER